MSYIYIRSELRADTDTKIRSWILGSEMNDEIRAGNLIINHVILFHCPVGVMAGKR